MSTTGERGRNGVPAVFYSPEVVDLCAGPGGWDEGVRHLGIYPLGIEIDDVACATATIAGHARVQGDISAIDPKVYLGARGLIASPPCQGFSMAGKGDGRKDAELLLTTIRDDFAIDPASSIAKLHDQMHDPRSVLVLEPLRWALALMPDWIALEQVPTVLPIWEAIAEVLGSLGYSVETGICSAEEYGVPQTRERAILVARSPEMVAQLGPARLAPATHSYYHRRNPSRLDEGVLPWVSMAEALSWGMTERPYFTVAAGTAQGGTDAAMLGGSGARASLDREIQAGRWKQRSNYSGPGKPGETAAERGLGVRDLDLPSFAITSKGFHWVPDEDATVKTGNFSAKVRDADGERSAAGSVPFERSVDAPAPTVTGTAGRWEAGPGHWEPTDTALVPNARSNATVRRGDQPAATITGGHDAGERHWVPAGLDADSGETYQLATAGPTARWTSGQVPRDQDQPAATITGKGTAYWTAEGLTRDQAPGAQRSEPLPEWASEGPSTTVAGDPRIGRPGHKHRGPGCCGADQSEAQHAKSVRVTVTEAAILQSFPADYPWQGNKGDQHRQVGDAVPPLMAQAIVRAVTTLDTRAHAPSQEA